jgi:hypothetical protein
MFFWGIAFEPPRAGIIPNAFTMSGTSETRLRRLTQMRAHTSDIKERLAFLFKTFLNMFRNLPVA